MIYLIVHVDCIESYKLFIAEFVNIHTHVTLIGLLKFGSQRLD